MLRKYKVVFSYSIVVEAEDVKTAEDSGIRAYTDISPTIDEMSIAVENL